jgi:hypothetical protein
LAQAAPDAVQIVRPGGGISVQQAWPTAPQLPQLPLAQVPPTEGHALDEPVQLWLMQQPPPLHALPLQHDWPAPPHGAQEPLLQTRPLPPGHV